MADSILDAIICTVAKRSEISARSRSCTFGRCFLDMTSACPAASGNASSIAVQCLDSESLFEDIWPDSIWQNIQSTRVQRAYSIKSFSRLKNHDGLPR